MRDQSAVAASVALMAALLAALLVGAAPAVAQQALASAMVHGQVLDQRGARPISEAVIRVTPGRAWQTDRRGFFSVGPLAPGLYVFEISAAGYVARTDTLRVSGPGSIDVVIRLAVRAMELPPIVIRARSRRLEDVGFFERLRGGPGGHFITRDDIEQRRPAELIEMLRDLPGIVVAWIDPVGHVLRVNRSINFRPGAGCTPAYYMDGVRMRGVDNPNMITPGQIEGVEVYVGASTPVEYPDPCGVVLIWSRAPPRSN